MIQDILEQHNIWTEKRKLKQLTASDLVNPNDLGDKKELDSKFGNL